MVFSIDDIWFLMLVKVIILGLAIAIIGRIICQSLWNCNERSISWSAAVRHREFRPILRNSLAVLVNLLFIWIMVQGLVLLIFGYFSVSPKELVNWRFHEITLIGVLAMVWQYSRYKCRSIQLS